MKLFQRESLDPLFHGSPLRRPSVARLVVAVLALLLAAAAAMSLVTMAGLGRDGTGVFLRALAAATVLSAAPVAIVAWLDRRERESPWLYAIAFLWGGVIAAWLSMPLNTLLLLRVEHWVAGQPAVTDLLGDGAALLLGAPLAAPLVEETIKGLGILLLFFLLRAEFDNVRDGFVYGALVGAGFTWAESALYVAQGYAEHGRAPYGLQLGARYALFGMAGHVLFSGLFGAFVGLGRETARRGLAWLAPPFGLLFAMAAHLANNALPLVGALMLRAAGEPPPAADRAPPPAGFVATWIQASVLDLIVFLPFVALLGWMLVRSGRYERLVIRSELDGETAPIVLDEERDAIARDGAFRTRRIDRLHRRVSAALVRLQHELAFRKRRVRDRGGDPEADPLVARWRGEIRRLRARA
ncbi:MAG: PrsW family intramembrane metalloprotease [Burkholderiales bacterium]|nr:PrsW family intramembrane metalloprotease [Burkholderiales bacterium]